MIKKLVILAAVSTLSTCALAQYIPTGSTIYLNEDFANGQASTGTGTPWASFSSNLRWDGSYWEPHGAGTNSGTFASSEFSGTYEYPLLMAGYGSESPDPFPTLATNHEVDIEFAVQAPSEYYGGVGLEAFYISSPQAPSLGSGSSPLSSTIPFDIWFEQLTDGTQHIVFWAGGDEWETTSSLNAVYVFKVTIYCNGTNSYTYKGYVNGMQKISGNTQSFYPNCLWLGNPIYNTVSPYTFTDLNVDYVHIWSPPAS